MADREPPSGKTVNNQKSGGNKAEHSGLLFIPNSVESVTRFLAEHFTDKTTTLATIDSLLYYLDYPNG